MTAAAVIIVLRKPRPTSTNPNAYEERSISVYGASGASDAELLRQAADQVEGPTVPPQS